jgi:hypothetical protein
LYLCTQTIDLYDSYPQKMYPHLIDFYYLCTQKALLMIETDTDTQTDTDKIAKTPTNTDIHTDTFCDVYV